ISAMAASYLIEVRRCQPHGPYFLGGLCAGGVISFEMAAQLERDGEEVELVVLLDAVEPTIRPRRWLTSLRRLGRVRGVLEQTRASEGPGRGKARPDLWKALRKTVRKARNLTEYEIF